MSMELAISDLIAKKRDGKVLETEEIKSFVTKVVQGVVQDGQLGAMLMAICLNGLNTEETVALTGAMRDSGSVLSWPEEWRGLVVDKHSTGGVGDKVSLVLAPALAACGMKVPMISGRGLGHTGGTLDKLESIEGYQVSLSEEEIRCILETVGCCIVGQTASLAPADKKLYATRDVTATVESIPLITASIICKKAAEGLDALVLDVKCGKGAFLKTKKDATILAKTMVSAGNGLGIKTVALVTDMNSPLGNMIGNSLEVIEAIRCLQGRGPKDLHDIVIELGGVLLDRITSTTNGKNRIAVVIESGEALKKFSEMLQAQHVDNGLTEQLCRPDNDIETLLPAAKHITDILVPHSGYIQEIDAMQCAIVTRDLGAGRTVAEAPINHAVGLELIKHVGSHVNEGDVWMKVHHDTEQLFNTHRTMLTESLRIGDKLPTISRVINLVE